MVTPVSDETDPSSSDCEVSESLLGPGLVLILLILSLAWLAFLIFFMGDVNSSDGDEEIRQRAESVLAASFDDTNAENFGELVSIDVRYEDNVLVVRWVQRLGTSEKSCHSPVYSNADFTDFGIVPFDAVGVDAHDAAEASCVQTTSLVHGIPVDDATKVTK